MHLSLSGGFIKGKQPSIFLSVVGSFGFDLVGSHPENGLTVVSPPEDGEVFLLLHDQTQLESAYGLLYH